MNRNEHYYDRENQNRSYDQNEGDYNLSNYLSRYNATQGNYYGMPDQEHVYRNVSSSQGSYYGSNTPGPVGGYGASSHRGAFEQQGNRRQGAQQHQNQWENTGYSHRGEGDRDKDNYNSGSGSRDHYRYGDPNPYMSNQRNGGYERTRGTGWREGGADYNNNERYSRQENSYRNTGHGRRFDQYGTDENYNYAHGSQTGRRSIENSENLDDRYYDRGEHTRDRSQNDYGNYYGSNYDSRNRNREGRNDNYSTGSYSSNKAYLADHGQDRDEGLFDHTSDNYPSRSPRGYGRKSGPDWSADSPISSQGQSDLRG
ncbi:hypothetical protein [Pontibacter ruber]|uniref:SWFGD domain-containing protein n=1 Tax=Pontibacter ruber TaxID=1343895 RepID=A0ABW5CXJ9_9BACT|nr:hypothetical protein [Pontibacter ruber]